jgi:hypothetical protein
VLAVCETKNLRQSSMQHRHGPLRPYVFPSSIINNSACSSSLYKPLHLSLRYQSSSQQPRSKSPAQDSIAARRSRSFSTISYLLLDSTSIKAPRSQATAKSKMQFLSTIMVAILALTPAIMAAPGALRPLEKRSCDCVRLPQCTFTTNLSAC